MRRHTAVFRMSDRTSGPPKGRNSRSESTKKHIETAYLTLMLEKKWDRISVIELCKAAGITRGTFYQYFDDIYDVIEKIEAALMEDLTSRFKACTAGYGPGFSISRFPDRFDLEPPGIFREWFSFCREHSTAMYPLLDRKKGDTRFIRRIRSVIQDNINILMDHDGMPNDELRAHFVSVLSEMHFLAAQGWLSGADDGIRLDDSDIVSLLNTMRVGSVYLQWRSMNGKNDPAQDLNLTD